MFQIILLLAVFALLLYKYAIKPMTYWEQRGVKQSRKVWLLGDNWKILTGKEGFVDMVYNAYNEIPGVRYSGIYQFTVPTLIVKDLELIKQIGVKDFEHFVDHRPILPDKADPLWGKNLFALKGQKWKEMRAILTPSFTSSKMKMMFELMNNCCENFTRFFLDKNQDTIEVEMKNVFSRFANDLIATTAFGIGTDSLKHQDNEFYLMGKEITNFTGFLKTLKFFGYFLFPKLFEILNIRMFKKSTADFFTNLIGNTIKTRTEKGIIRPDMINILMEAQKRSHGRNGINISDNGRSSTEKVSEENFDTKALTTNDIAAQAMIFFFAGFDTVSTVLSFMSHELALNPDVQNKLRKEIDETLEECDGTVTHEALLKMKYLDMVLSETLRKWPAATSVDRLCTKPYIISPTTSEEEPIPIDAGTVILIPIFGIHRDPKLYPDPERFDPERFNEENKKSIDPLSYLPFGIGPRNCIGNRFALLEIKLLMFHLLSAFEIVPIAKTRIPIRLTKNTIGLQSEDGFWLGMKRIQ